MKRIIVLVIITLFFTIITFIGAGYVLTHNGNVNAGYAVVPCLFCLISLSFLNIAVAAKNKKNHGR